MFTMMRGIAVEKGRSVSELGERPLNIETGDHALGQICRLGVRERLLATVTISIFPRPQPQSLLAVETTSSTDAQPGQRGGVSLGKWRPELIRRKGLQISRERHFFSGEVCARGLCGGGVKITMQSLISQSDSDEVARGQRGFFSCTASLLPCSSASS